MTAAAITGPTPKMPVRLVPAACTGRIDLLAGLADPGVDAAQVGGLLGGKLPAGRGHRVRWGD